MHLPALIIVYGLLCVQLRELTGGLHCEDFRYRAGQELAEATVTIGVEVTEV